MSAHQIPSSAVLFTEIKINKHYHFNFGTYKIHSNLLSKAVITKPTETQLLTILFTFV